MQGEGKPDAVFGSAGKTKMKKKIEQWAKREIFASLTKEKEREGGRKERKRATETEEKGKR